jgi:hypothetical protein
MTEFLTGDEKGMTEKQIKAVLRKAPAYSQFHVTLERKGGTEFKPYFYKDVWRFVQRKALHEMLEEGCKIFAIEYVVVRPPKMPKELPAEFQKCLD